MVEVLSSIATAINIAKQLKEISSKVKDAEFKNLLADLSLELSGIKMQLAEVIDENTHLKAKVRTLETAEGDPCPKCHKRGWHVEASRPHPRLGRLGAVVRTNKCSFCDFTEDELITPK